MRATSLSVTLTAVFFSVPAAGQLSSNVGPPVAPVGCPIAVTITNDTNGVEATGICPYEVFDDAGNLVYTPFCLLIALQMPPGTTFTASWEQIDDDFQQVPPGTYTVDVRLPDNSVESHEIVIADVDGGMASLGVQKTGEERRLRLCSPSEGGATYVAMASLGAGGIPTCGGTLPLDPDAVWLLSLNSSGGFVNFLGFLDGDGLSSAPALDIPDKPGLQGVEMHFAYVLFDSVAPCPVYGVSEPYAITIQ